MAALEVPARRPRAWAHGQRVRKRQPDGGFRGRGRPPRNSASRNRPVGSQGNGQPEILARTLALEFVLVQTQRDFPFRPNGISANLRAKVRSRGLNLASRDGLGPPSRFGRLTGDLRKQRRRLAGTRAPAGSPSNLVPEVVPAHRDSPRADDPNLRLARPFFSGASRDRTGDLLLAKSERARSGVDRMPVSPDDPGFWLLLTVLCGPDRGT
jgi:hypothetical protein